LRHRDISRKLYRSFELEGTPKIATGREGLPPVYHLGDRMTIALQSSRPGNYVLLNQDAGGRNRRTPGRAHLMLVVADTGIDEILSGKKDIDRYRGHFSLGELEYQVAPDQSSRAR
jgi:hypothetical protein